MYSVEAAHGQAQVPGAAHRGVNALGELVLSTRSRRRPDSRVADGRGSLSDADLLAAAQDVAELVRREVSHPGAMVAVELPLGTDAVVWLLGAVLGDFSVCFLDPAAPEPRREALRRALAPEVDVSRNRLVTTPRSAGEPRPRRHAGYVAMSSGSTGGGPKGVLSSWEGIAAFVPWGAEELCLDAGDVWAELSHLSYDLAMTNVLVSLAAGISIELSPNLGDRLRPIGFTERVRATHVRLAPRFVELAVNERIDRGPRSLRVWGSGGDRLSATHARQVFELGVPTLVNTYGTSETVGFASAARLDAHDTLPTAQGTVTIGRGEVGPWRTFLAGTGSGEPERPPPDGLSMLGIASPHLPTGYVFGRSSGEYPQWVAPDRVVTGDVGSSKGGHLFCLGRAGRRVKRSASFVDLDAVDAVIGEAENARSFTVATTSGRLVSLVEGPVALEELRHQLVGRLRPDTVPDALVAVAVLPRLGNGKVDQGEAQRLAEDGDTWPSRAARQAGGRP